MIRILKLFLLLLILLGFSCRCSADTLTINNVAELHQSFTLEPYLSVFEDTERTLNAGEVINKPLAWEPLFSLHQHDPTSVYWLKMDLKNGIGQKELESVLSFTQLTFVDLYVFENNQLIDRRYAGGFRKKSQILTDDTRFSFSVNFQPGKIYTLLLKVHHTKHYHPRFDFTLQEKNVFLKMNGQRMMQDMWMLGAVSIFFLYILLSWVVTRYRPYIWLLLFITGIGLYALTVSGYLVDWFFSENPQTGWMLNIHFTHMGLFGVYMLILDFWQLKIKSLFLYRWCLLVLTGVGFVSMISFCLDYFASNYNLMNNINLVSFIFPLSFISYTIPTCWRSLNRAQRYLAYGIILFVISAIAVTLSSALLHEKALQFSPYIVNFTMVGIVVLFSTGLKEELRQAEIDKQAALNELSLLQQNQNIVLEQKVEVRTSELIHSYKELQVQKNILGERNQKIEILINELHHRVKNNLQLLYSFMSLQLPGVKDQAAQDILHNNITRIKAMMLVNNRLSGLSDGSQTDIPAFTEELIKSVQNVYDPRKKVQIELSIDDHSHFNGKQTLSYGLILTELLTNSFKHAFSDHQDPRICISMHSSAKQQSELIYKDNGPGIPHTATNQSSSMGLSLIKDLSRQMQASLLVKYEHGLTYIFTFK